VVYRNFFARGVHCYALGIRTFYLNILLALWQVRVRSTRLDSRLNRHGTA
jgi:hypothetical protein